MRIPVVFASIALLAATPALADAPSPQGNWSRGDGKAKVRVEPCGKDLCAVNTWIKPGVKDEKEGDKLVMTVTEGAAGKWTGKAYDPQRKLTLRFTMTVKDATMTTVGCVWGGLLCKSMGWTRLES